MRTNKLGIWALVLLLLIATGQRCVAQTTTATNLSGDGYIDLFKPASTTNAFTPPTSLQAGAHFLWWPQHGALFIGNVTPSVGTDDFGAESISLGTMARAVGTNSVALGFNAIAAEEKSIAIGGAAFGANSLAMAGGQTVSPKSVAIGYLASVGNSDDDVSLGVAIGANSGVFRPGGVALGQYATVDGNGGIAIGAVYCTSVFGVAVGAQNTGLKKDGSLPNGAVPSASDPIFEVGNGIVDPSPSVATTSNAFTVFRDGTVRLSKASGGIAMGQFQ